MNASDLVTINPETSDGTPVFNGTHVPVRLLFKYFADNYTLDEFLECFPSVTRELACQVLECSAAGLAAAAAGGKEARGNDPGGRAEPVA
jgi:uncharacterized protein (DUF433 family)